MDIVGKVFSYIFAVIVMFTVPVIIITVKLDQNIQTYANDAVEEFVDKARATGIITSTSYEEMIGRLDATGVTYDIYLTHTKTRVEPKVNEEDGSISVGASFSGTEEYFKADIFASLYPDAPSSGVTAYYMENGDFIKVVAQNNTPTLGSRMLRMIYPGYEGKNILVAKSGYVGNETEEN